MVAIEGSFNQWIIFSFWKFHDIFTCFKFIAFGIRTYPLQYKYIHTVSEVRRRKTASLFLGIYCTQINQTDTISNEFDIGTYRVLCIRVRVTKKRKVQRWLRKPNPQHARQQWRAMWDDVTVLVTICACVCMYVFTSERHTDKMRRNGENTPCQNHTNHLRRRKKSNKMKNGQKTKWNIKWNTVLMDLNWQKRWIFVSILPSHSAYIHHNWCNDWPNWWWCVLHMAWRTKLLFDMIANFFFLQFRTTALTIIRS